MKSLTIPHLNFTIKYGVNKKEVSKGAVMTTEDIDNHTVAIYFQEKPKLDQMPTVAHEVMHVLQFVCRHRKIMMENELEHMGYLMQYILASIYGYKMYSPKK